LALRHSPLTGPDARRALGGAADDLLELCVDRRLVAREHLDATLALANGRFGVEAGRAFGRAELV